METRTSLLPKCWIKWTILVICERWFTVDISQCLIETIQRIYQWICVWKPRCLNKTSSLLVQWSGSTVKGCICFSRSEVWRRKNFTSFKPSSCQKDTAASENFVSINFVLFVSAAQKREIENTTDQTVVEWLVLLPSRMKEISLTPPGNWWCFT